MNIGKHLKTLRAEAGISQAKAAEILQNQGFDVKTYSISQWECGRRKPGVEEFLALCEIYGIDDRLQHLNAEPTKIKEFAPLLSQLNSEGINEAKRYISYLLGQSYFTKEGAQIPQRTYRLYDIPVSAGTGMYLDSDDYEEITADDLVPEDADYAVKVRGDSMEPKYHDGQILFIKEQSDINDGEIGIFLLNGETFVKQYKHRAIISFNRSYEPIKISEHDEFRVLGKVLS